MPGLIFSATASSARFLSRPATSSFFEFAVLALQLLELTGLVEVHLAELLFPPVETDLGDVVLAVSLLNALASVGFS